MESEDIDIVGGIPVADRTVPWWLLAVVVGIAAVAVWYLLSFSSTPYHGGFSGSEQAPAAATE